MRICPREWGRCNPPNLKSANESIRANVDPGLENCALGRLRGLSFSRTYRPIGARPILRRNMPTANTTMPLPKKRKLGGSGVTEAAAAP